LVPVAAASAWTSSVAPSLDRVTRGMVANLGTYSAMAGERASGSA